MDDTTVKTEYTADEILCAAVNIGENILINGGEIQRVEDTVERICKSFGAVQIEVFVITSLVMASVRMPDGEYSQQIRRVYGSENNLTKVELLNDLSRELCEGRIGLEKTDSEIEKIKNVKAYPFYIYYIASMLAAGSFSVFFGGDLIDGLAGALVGLLVTFVARHMPKYINPLIADVIEALIGGFSAVLLCRIGFGHNISMIMIGSIMLLIPGLAMGNSIRDMLSGDTLSGTLRFLQSFLTALMIAFGYAVAIYLNGGAV